MISAAPAATARRISRSAASGSSSQPLSCDFPDQARDDRALRLFGCLQLFAALVARARLADTVIAWCPLFKDRLQRILLCPVDDVAAFPCHGPDQFLDLPLDAGAKIVRVQRVKLPTTMPEVADEPLVSRVLPLIPCGE